MNWPKWFIDPAFDAQQLAHDNGQDARRIRDMGITYPACRSGPCQQGTRPCPSPQSCALPVSDLPRVQRWLLSLFQWGTNK